MLTTSTVAGRAAHREGVPVPGRATKLAVPGPDRANPDQPVALRDGVPGARTAADPGAVVGVGGGPADAGSDGTVPGPQEDGGEAHLRGRQLQDRRPRRDRRVRLDCQLPARRAQQLHADPHPLPLQHHELHPPRLAPRDQGAHLL